MEKIKLDLRTISGIMDMTEIVLGEGTKYEGDYPTLGGFDWKGFRVVLMSNGDVVLVDDKQERSMYVFSSDRTQNNQEMETRGKEFRIYLIKEFLSTSKLNELREQKEDKEILPS